jgi:hypothetical protein
MRKKDGKPSIVPGLILIFIGIVAVLNNFEAINLDWEVLWTYFILLLGLIFWLGFIFDRSKDGLIMPGTILLTYGIILNLHMRFGNMDILWPFFILGPAFGFYAMYLLGKRDRGLLIPAVILTIIGSIFLLQSYSYIRYVWPLVLVVLGVLLLLRNNRDGGGDQGKQE